MVRVTQEAPGEELRVGQELEQRRQRRRGDVASLSFGDELGFPKAPRPLVEAFEDHLLLRVSLRLLHQRRIGGEHVLIDAVCFVELRIAQMVERPHVGAVGFAIEARPEIDVEVPHRSTALGVGLDEHCRALAAGRYGAGLMVLSGVDDASMRHHMSNWAIYEETCARHGHAADRARWQFDNGLLEEAAALRERYDPALPAFSAMGYREAFALLAGEISREDAIELTARRTRQFARRQRTWFRAEPDVEWLDAAADPLPRAAAVARALSVPRSPGRRARR